MKSGFQLKDYTNWGLHIHAAARKFYEMHNEWPLLLNANLYTIDRLKSQIAYEIKISDRDHYELTHFECPEFDIHFSLDSSLDNDCLNLIRSEEAVTLIGWRKLLRLFPKIKATKEFGSVETLTGHFPHSVPAEIVNEFTNEAYEQNLILNFDWMHWSEGKELLKNDTDFNKCDLLTLQKVLTVIIRRERFSEGSLVFAFESGFVQRILKAARELTRG